MYVNRAVPVASEIRSASSMSAAAAANSPAWTWTPRPVVQRDGEEGQRPGVARAPEPRRGEVVPRVISPDVRRDPGRQQPAAVVLAAVILAAEDVDRPPERPDCGHVAVAEACGQTIEHEVHRARRLRRRWGRARRLGYLSHTVLATEPPAEHRRSQRLEVGVARELRIERLEPTGRGEQ